MSFKNFTPAEKCANNWKPESKLSNTESEDKGAFDYLQSKVSRNLEGWPTPEMIEEEQDPVEKRKLQRCNAFVRGALLFYPFMPCTTCDTVYDMADFHGEFADDDAEDDTMPCPGCFQPNIVMMRVSAMHVQQGKELPYRKQVILKNLDKDDNAYSKYKLAEFEPAVYTEEVQMLGSTQIMNRFVHLAMATPLILLTAQELVKQQHTLAYNMYFYYTNFQNTVKKMRTLARSLLDVADAQLYDSLSSKPSLHEFVTKDQHMEPQIKIEKVTTEEVKETDDAYSLPPPQPGYVVVWHNWRMMQTNVATELREVGHTVDPSRERHDFSIESFIVDASTGSRVITETIRIKKVGLDKNIQPVRKALFELLDVMIESSCYSVIKVFVPLDQPDITDASLMRELELQTFRYVTVVEYQPDRLVPELCRTSKMPLSRAQKMCLEIFEAESDQSSSTQNECPVCLKWLDTNTPRDKCSNCGIVSVKLEKSRAIEWETNLAREEVEEEKGIEIVLSELKLEPAVVVVCDYCKMVERDGPIKLGFCVCDRLDTTNQLSLCPSSKIN